jgi:HEAT repeat protein
MAAAETIGALGVAEVDGVLTELAEDEDPRVRQAVARTFARLDNTPCGHQQLCKAILSLARDPDSLVRAEIAPMFGKSDCVDSISALLVLSMDEFRDVRLAAIRTLAKRRDPAARRALRVATGDESRSIRAAAVRGLAGDPGDEDIALVLSLLLDGDPGTVISAIGALAESGSPGATHAIVRLFDHEAADVREAVLRALAAEDPSAARDLAAVVLSGVEPAWNVRLAAAQVLVGCDAGGRAVVERALRDPEPMVRAAAVAAVPGAFGDESGEILVTRLADADLREATRDALIAMGDSGGAAIAGALDVLTGPARRSATFALAAIGDQIGCEALRGLLSSADAEDRWLAVSALAANGCHGIDIASAATGEPDQTMRRIIERVAAAGAQR